MPQMLIKTQDAYLSKVTFKKPTPLGIVSLTFIQHTTPQNYKRSHFWSSETNRKYRRIRS